MVELNWTEDAINDLINIGEYIELDSIKYASVIVNSIFSYAEILKISPKAGRIVPEFQKNNIRELIKGNYRIVYNIVTRERLDILTIHHCKRILSNNSALLDLF